MMKEIYDRHYNDIFSRGIMWEIQFNPSTDSIETWSDGKKKLFPLQRLTPSPSPMILDPETEKNTALFLEKFAEMCEFVSKEKLLEKEKLIDLVNLSDEELEEKSNILEKNIQALNDLVEKFREMMRKFEKNQENE